jgi:hypothetical protein
LWGGEREGLLYPILGGLGRGAGEGGQGNKGKEARTGKGREEGQDEEDRREEAQLRYLCVSVLSFCVLYYF